MAREKVTMPQFNGMCKTGARMSAVPLGVFVENELAKILEETIRLMPKLKVGKLRARYASATFSTQPGSLYTPRHPSPGRGANVKYYLRNRYPDALWTAISQRRRDKLIRTLRARGLAAKSFAKIARKLGLNIKIAGYIERALASTGVEYDDVSASKEKTSSKIRIDFVNAQPTANLTRVGGQRALDRAVAGRMKFFERNIQHQVFNEVQKIARAYPGIKVHLRAA